MAAENADEGSTFRAEPARRPRTAMRNKCEASGGSAEWARIPLIRSGSYPAGPEGAPFRGFWKRDSADVLQLCMSNSDRLLPVF